MIKEALEKISSLYEFGIIDKEVFLLCGNKKHDIERITRTIQEASVLIERIFYKDEKEKKIFPVQQFDIHLSYNVKNEDVQA